MIQNFHTKMKAARRRCGAGVCKNLDESDCRKGAGDMTIRQEAYKLIDALPDSSVSFVISIIRNMSHDFYDGTVFVETVSLNQEAKRKLKQIASLGDNWNGNGAEAFSKGHIRLLDSIIDGLKYTPEVFPTGCNTIQLEYDKVNGDHLEIEVPENGKAEFYYVDSDGIDKSGVIDIDVSEINGLIRSFYESEL